MIGKRDRRLDPAVPAADISALRLQQIVPVWQARLVLALVTFACGAIDADVRRAVRGAELKPDRGAAIEPLNEQRSALEQAAPAGDTNRGLREVARVEGFGVLRAGQGAQAQAAE